MKSFVARPFNTMTPDTLPAAGLHYGVPYEVYASWPAANFSKIKAIRYTASKCKYEIDNPKKPTPAMVIGDALHIATLEPGRFEGKFHIYGPCDLRTKEGKAYFAEQQRIGQGKLMIRRKASEDESEDESEETPKKSLLGQIELVRGMAKSIHAMKAASRFLDGAGQNEVSALWKDTETGLWCKARFDRNISNLDIAGVIHECVVEIKSDRDASEWAFAKTVDARGYGAQAVGYATGLRLLTGKPIFHVFIVVENFPPFDCAIYTLQDESLQTGYLQYRQMLSRYAECLKTNKWPGYKDEIQPLSMPGYSHERDYDS